ncbi:MAG: inositol monophosphatase family protein [Mariprofundaceae bacterium]|nr:inositol monophosphatase family protein [Mariprofundaceae bacterium]
MDRYQMFSDPVSSLLKKAGEAIIMPAFRRQASAKVIKEDGSVVTETDLKCQQFLQDALLALYPDIAFLGEEMSHEKQLECLNSGGRFWCVDPLDGTSNFTIPLPHFASSLALIENGRPVFACIHDPLLNETFTAAGGSGVFLNNRPIHTSPRTLLASAVGFIDFKRLEQQTAAMLATTRLFRSQRNIGTCALEWAWLAAGRAHFIIHGGEKIWDYSAGLLIAEEAGAVVTDFNGRHPFHARQLSSPILAASHESIHRQLLSVLQEL